MKFFPVTYVKTEIGQLFINLKEFINTPGALEILFDEGSQSTKEDENAEKINYEPKENVRTKELVNKGGQRSIVELFPNIIDITSEFLKQHGLAAQCRRRNDTGYSSGVTVSQIRKHLLEFVPGLREHNISHSTVRRFLKHRTHLTMRLQDIQVTLMQELEQNVILTGSLINMHTTYSPAINFEESLCHYFHDLLRFFQLTTWQR